MDAAKQQSIAADGGEEEHWEDTVWRERHLLMAVINNLRSVADAALDRAETAEEAAKAAERSEAAAVQRCREAESAQTMQSSIEARIRDSVVAEVHEAVRAASEEATAELRAAASEIRRLRARPISVSGMSSAGLEPEAEAVADEHAPMNELRTSCCHRPSTASKSVASSSSLAVRPADQENRDVQAPVASQGVPRPKTDVSLGHIRANLDTLFALVQEPSLESLGQESVAAASHRTSSVSTRKSSSFHTLEKSASQGHCSREDGHDTSSTAATPSQAARKPRLHQRESQNHRVSRNKTEPLRVTTASVKPSCRMGVRDFVSKLERQRESKESQQSSLERPDQQCLEVTRTRNTVSGGVCAVQSGADEEKCTRSSRAATIADPHPGMRRSMEARHLSLGSKHGTSKAPGCAANAARASVQLRGASVAATLSG